MLELINKCGNFLTSVKLIEQLIGFLLKDSGDTDSGCLHTCGVKFIQCHRHRKMF